MVVFIHPTGFTHPDRFRDHYFFNHRSPTGGDDLRWSPHPPRGDGASPGLQIVFAHGGGYLPMYAGRFDHAYHAREDVRQGVPRPPSEYLATFYFDTMVFAPTSPVS